MRKILLLLFVLVFGLMQVNKAQSGYALSLPGGSAGASSNMSVPVLSSLITGYPFTIEMWVNPSTITAYDGFFYDKNGTNKTSLQFANATTGEMRFDLFGQSNVVTLSSAKKLAVGKWQHLAVTVYQDSAVVEIDGSFYANTHTKTFTNFGSTAPAIGWDKDVADRAFGGYMDEIRIWNTGRSRAEILSNKSVVLAGTETGLVAYYTFDNNNANDKTANALNGTVTGGTLVNLNTVSTLSALTITGGYLNPVFAPGTTNYTIYAPADVSSVVVTGFATAFGIASVTNNPATLSATSSSVVMSCTSGDGLSTTDYTINFVRLTINDWSGNGATGALSYPYMWGWGNTTTSIPWNTANGGGGCRFRDVGLDTYTGFTHEEDSRAATTRQLMLRFDNGAYSGSYYSFPVILQGCKTYDFSWDYVLGGSVAPPSTITVGIDTVKTGVSRLSSKTFTTTSNAKIYRHGIYTFLTPSRNGVYYITINAAVAGWYGITNLALAESTTPIVTVNPRIIALTNLNKSAQITIRGNALTSDVTLVAPAGITLSRTTVPASETPCGTTVTATYDYTQSITSGIITFTSGAAADTVAFTYTRPTVSIYEKNIEVENNNRPYPLNIKTVSNSVDSLYISPTSGFSVVKNSYSVTDFTNGSGSINVLVNSSATVGTTGKIYFYYKPLGVVTKIDSVNVTKVATYTRYYIKNSVGGLVIGDHSTGLYPALTDITGKGIKKQKFILRKVNIDPAATADTFYIIQDSVYRVMRKVASSGWDTEFGVPSNEAKWTRQLVGTADTFNITNVVLNKLLGTDATTANSRLYDNKTAADATFKKWIFIDASPSDSTLSSITLNTGTLRPAFNTDIVTYQAILPVGTTSVTPTVVTTIVGATVTGDGAVDVSSGSGVSTIVVTATDGKSKMTYTINYVVARIDDATLTSLTLSVGTLNPSFSPATTSYTVTLPIGTTSVTATAVPNVPGLVVTGDGVVDVSSGSGTSTITVTALDGTTQLTYTVAYTVLKSTVATLSDLRVDGTQVSGFATNTFTYIVKLPANTTTVPTVEGTATDAAKASVTVTPASTLPDTTIVEVTAEDGTTKLTYTISFVLKSTVATLSDLRVSGTQVSGFATNTTTYSVKLPANTTTVPTVAGTATDAANASVSVTPASALPGSTTVEVTAEDGNKMTYTISFALKSAVATLSDLKVGGTTVTGFAAATTTYSVVLPIGTTTVPTVTATATDSTKATMVITPASALPGSTTVKVTAEDTTSKSTYTINFTVAKSTDATLSNLTVDGVAVAGFASNVYTYTVNLPAGTTLVPTVVGTPTYSGAGVAVVDATALPGYTVVVVTPESGSAKTYTVNFTVGTGVPQFAGSAIKVYPTVTSGSFTVEGAANATITVLDTKGRVILKQVAASSVQMVNIKGTGIYIIKVNSNGGSRTFKVVKTN